MKAAPNTCGILLFLLFPWTGFGQESELGNWFIYLGDKKIRSAWNWHHEVQYRNYNAVGDLEQLLLRTGIGHNLSENNNNVLLGYAFILSQNYVEDEPDKVEVRENRMYQQFITRQEIGFVSLQHRYRFEQRWIEADFSFRFRYFLSLNIPLNNSEMVDKTFYLSGYNELFLNDRGDVFDRNRLFGGMGFRYNQQVRFEVGYMNQFLPGPDRDQINLITFINL